MQLPALYKAPPPSRTVKAAWRWPCSSRHGVASKNRQTPKFLSLIVVLPFAVALLQPSQIVIFRAFRCLLLDLNQMQHLCDPGISPSSANCVLGKVCLRSNLSRKCLLLRLTCCGCCVLRLLLWTDQKQTSEDGNSSSQSWDLSWDCRVSNAGFRQLLA